MVTDTLIGPQSVAWPCTSAGMPFWPSRDQIASKKLLVGQQGNIQHHQDLLWAWGCVSTCCGLRLGIERGTIDTISNKAVSDLRAMKPFPRWK